MHADISRPAEVLELQKASIGFVKYIKDRLDIQLVKHINYEGEEIVDDVKYKFFRSKNKFRHIPIRTNRYVQRQQPDIVLIQGFIFPLQLLALRLMLKKKTKIIVQHHGEKPFRGIKKIFQQLARYFVHGYVFTAKENSEEWIKNGIIPAKEMCYEVLEASICFQKKDRESARSSLNLSGILNFLWVGRLNTGKDPITVLKAFEKYINNHNAKLFMIYQTDELLPEINKLFAKNECLEASVILVGSVAHAELETWYNGADFYFSGSHNESTGFALLEAMACGCIPVVTSIPSFKKITCDGKFGFLFEPGNEQNLLNILCRLTTIDHEKLSSSVAEHFSSSLSFKSIADALYTVCEKLIAE